MKTFNFPKLFKPPSCTASPASGQFFETAESDSGGWPCQSAAPGRGRWIFSCTGPHKYRLVMIDFYPSHAMKGYKWFYNHDLQLYTARTVKMMQEKDVNSIYKHVKTIELENFSRQIAARGSKHLHRGLGRTSSGGAAPTSFWNPTKSRGAIPRFLRSIVFVFFWLLGFGVMLMFCHLPRLT